MNLRRRAAVRHLARHPWQLALSVLGVALGVAVIVAIDLAVESSREAFRVSTEAVAGRATHRALGGPGGVPDSLVARLRIDGGARAAAPAVEGYVASPLLADRPLRLLGVDPFAEGPFRPWLGGAPGEAADGATLLTTRGGVILGGETARDLGVGLGDEVPLEGGAGGGPLRVVGVLEPDDAWSRTGLRDLLVVDLSEAQDRLGRAGRLDRIDLILPEGGEGHVSNLLPPGVRLEPAGTREAAMQEMIRAFDLNLTALSLLALVFGVFLIYNTMTFSVVQRRTTLGILRALGTTRGQVVRGVLAEAAVVGAVGAALGLLLGVALGRGLVRLVTRTINDLYFVVSVEGLALPAEVLVRGAILGVGAAVLAALPSAWEAGSVSPREALTRSALEARARGIVPRAAGAGAAGILVGAGCLLAPGGGVLLAFGGLFALVIGMALLVPAATVGAVALLRPAAHRSMGILGAMAARGVVTALSRTAPALAALVVAVSVTVGLGIMIQSFRGSVVDWLDITLRADLYVSSPSVVAARAERSLPPGLAGAARELSGVQGVGSSRAVEIVTDYGLTRLVALEPAGDPGAGFDLLEQAGPGGDVFRRFEAGEGLLVSEPFAFRHGLSPGDRVRLPGERGALARPVLGVVRDYGTEAGVVFLSRRLYDAHWDDEDRTSLALFLEEGADGAEVAASLRAFAGEASPLVIRSNRELRERSMEIFDRTFAVTRVLRVLAFIVAFIAVLSALMALQLERRRELGVLRANGLTPAQTWGLVTAQTGFMGAVAGLLALPVGVVLAFAMVHVVNRRSFGWTLQMEIPPALLLQAVGLAVAGALLAGIHPSWRMARTSPAEALREE